MYAVIFEACIKQLDADYAATAQRMRELAISQYGCLDFTSVTEGQKEISISYWSSLAQIQEWKQDQEHLQAQQQGKARWYESYKVRVVEIVRDYSSKSST